MAQLLSSILFALSLFIVTKLQMKQNNSNPHNANIEYSLNKFCHSTLYTSFHLLLFSGLQNLCKEMIKSCSTGLSLSL